MRKYQTELGVAIVVTPQIVGRQRDLERMSVPTNQPCHIYVVTEVPRMSIHPDDYIVDGRAIYGQIRRQNEDSFEYREFRFEFDLDFEIDWESEYPYEEFSIVDSVSREPIMSMSAYTLLSYSEKNADWLKHRVLYVGQAFGKTGERQAFDRLRDHSTLQRIYSERRPDREIWLSLCAITDVAIITAFNPVTPGVITGEEDWEHTKAVHEKINEGNFYSKEGVALAEAGLIRYFQPRYNKNFKDNFPDAKHVSLSECVGLDLHTLAVEFHGYGVRCSFYSDDVVSHSVHIKSYPLFEKDGRIELFG